MSKILIISISLLAYGFVKAQNLTVRYEVGSAGESATLTSGVYYSFTVGGLITETATAGNYDFTQGFEQPDRRVRLDVFNPPNAFTPDGDGVNDSWVIPLPASLISENEVTILNRWGDVIANFVNYNNIDVIWDGIFHQSGEEVPGGTYFYIAENRNTGAKYSGWVQVVK